MSDVALKLSGKMKEIKLNKNRFNEENDQDEDLNFVMTDDEYLNSLNITIARIVDELRGKYQILYDYAVKMKHYKKNCDDFIAEWENETIPLLEKRTDRNLFFFLENDMEKAKQARESIDYVIKNLDTVRFLKRGYVESQTTKNINELGKISVEY